MESSKNFPYNEAPRFALASDNIFVSRRNDREVKRESTGGKTMAVEINSTRFNFR